MASIQSVVDLLTKYINLLHGKNIHTEGDQDIAGIKNFTGTLQSGGYAVDSIYQTGDRYIRYNNGIQITWGGYCAITNYIITLSKLLLSRHSRIQHTFGLLVYQI